MLVYYQLVLVAIMVQQVTGSILANKYNISWKNKHGVMKPNYFGSLSQATTTFLGCNELNQQV